MAVTMFEVLNGAYEQAAVVCENEAAACIRDIVPGDEPGAKLAHARAGALLTAAGDIRELALTDERR